VVPPPDDHDCGWKGWATDLAQRLAETEAKLAAIERPLLGPKSEKLPKVPPMDREVAKKSPPDPRRRLFEALAYTPEARVALELIRDVYVVEHDVKAEGRAGTDEHTRMRQARSAPIMNRLKALLEEQRPLHQPKGPMGSAISYALNNWEELTRFLGNARIPPDNNRSESALRVVALGRKNFLFVGHEDAGANIAGLYSLVATCEANGVNPLAYLTDVLGRLGTPSVLDDLLPHRWKPSG
jgi:transposase